jgi:hypothetical protein
LRAQAYAGPLKMHAAGMISNGTSTALMNRGSQFFYWSSSNSDATLAKGLVIFTTQTYNQLSGPGSSEDSPGNRIMARVLQFADKGDPRYSYNPKDQTYTELKKGGRVKMSSASKRADGCATKGKTRGRMV